MSSTAPSSAPARASRARGVKLLDSSFSSRAAAAEARPSTLRGRMTSRHAGKAVSAICSCQQIGDGGDPPARESTCSQQAEAVRGGGGVTRVTRLCRPERVTRNALPPRLRPRREDDSEDGRTALAAVGERSSSASRRSGISTRRARHAACRGDERRLRSQASGRSRGGDRERDVPLPPRHVRALPPEPARARVAATPRSAARRRRVPSRPQPRWCPEGAVEVLIDIID